MEELSRFNLIGQSPIFKKAVLLIKRMAQLDETIRITGETGTGKELAARAIHYLGQRSEKPFVPVNCGALPESLVESELFGHERGAFTDAKTASQGLIGEATGGTLFLDEVDSLTLKTQAALLRFLQDKTYRRVGGSMRQVDIRIIVASNTDLAALVVEKRFREDLFYRLNVLTLTMPPLRERQDDVLLIAQRVLQKLSHQYRIPCKYLHPEARSFILSYLWPGNVRELENAIHREFLINEDNELRLCDFRQELVKRKNGEIKHVDVSLPFREAKNRAIADFERNYIAKLLERSAGNISSAARIAMQDRSAFGKMVRKYGLGNNVITD